MTTNEEIMLEIQNTLVSLDLIERFFCCDLDKCLGQCCVEGDAGAPITEAENKQIAKITPQIMQDLLPSAQRRIKEAGTSYIDEEGDLVTQIVDGRDCVFTCYDADGVCKCAIEKAYRAGKTDFYKPISCHLYPIRITQYRDFKAVNYHRWSVCKAAELLGEREKVPVYRFLKEPLIRKFGEAWYAALVECAEEWERQRLGGKQKNT